MTVCSIFVAVLVVWVTIIDSHLKETYVGIKDQINSLHNAAELINVQIEFLENIICLLGQVDVAISTLVWKKLLNGTVVDRKKKNFAKEKLIDTKLHANYLVHQGMNILKTMLNFMFPAIESDFQAENRQQIARELFQHLTECKFFFFNYLHHACDDLARDLESSLSQTDIECWNRMTEPFKKKCQENIAKLSEHYNIFNKKDNVTQPLLISPK